jgi:hypothetical protein
MKLLNQITLYGILTLVTSLFLVMGYASINHDPHWQIEDRAVASIGYPLAGFWKQDDCEEPWGLAIGPAKPGIYYVSFCGPGGCLEQGEYRPNTPLLNDPDYRVINENRLMFLNENRWSTMVRCESRN